MSGTLPRRAASMGEVVFSRIATAAARVAGLLLAGESSGTDS
jgi:hypothetical protein